MSNQRPSFAKRDREAKLKDKARAKAERRAEKRAAKVAGPAQSPVHSADGGDGVELVQNTPSAGDGASSDAVAPEAPPARTGLPR